MNPIYSSNLSHTDLTIAANANLAMHAAWVQERTPGMRVIEDAELVVVDSGLPCDTFNIVCRARLTAPNAQRRIREVIDHFAKAERPFAWWLNPGDEPEGLG